MYTLSDTFKSIKLKSIGYWMRFLNWKKVLSQYKWEKRGSRVDLAVALWFFAVSAYWIGKKVCGKLGKMLSESFLDCCRWFCSD